MGNFYRLELKGDCPPEAGPAGFVPVPYSRELHHGEIPLIYAEAFTEKPWGRDWEQFEGFDPRGVFLAAGGDGELAGYVISFKRRDHGYISVVAVKPRWQKRGAAAALIREAVKYLRSLGLKTVRIDVDENRTAALRLYAKLGFSVAENLPDPVPPGRPAEKRPEAGTSGLGEKIAGVVLAVAAAWLTFRLLVGGIFSFMLGRGPDNAIYLFFFGGYIALFVILGIGGAAGALLWWRNRRRGVGTPAAEAQSCLGRGLTLGLMVVVAAVLLLAGLSLWVFKAV